MDNNIFNNLEGTDLVLQEAEQDLNYEPTNEEILQYAQYLGMDLHKDQKYLYLAKEGLQSPLPEHWKAYKNQQEIKCKPRASIG